MKKVLILCISSGDLAILGLFFLAIFILNGGLRNYDGWQTVQIEGVGNFKVPQEWSVKQDDGVIYITEMSSENGTDKIQLLGTTWKIGTKNDNFPPYKLLEDTELVSSGRGVNYSNSAGYQIKEFSISGDIRQLYTIHLRGRNEYADFIVLNDSLDEKMIRKITQSFEFGNRK